MKEIERAQDLADTCHAANEAAQSQRRAYEKALDRFQTLCSQAIMNDGLEPAAASDFAKAQLSDQEKEDL